MFGVLLYGPPAAGKDTVTRALHALDPTYVLFRRLKVGPGRAVGYRLTSEYEISRLRQAGEVVWQNERYGATYVIDRPHLLGCLRTHVPVVHVGQLGAIDAVTNATPAATWLVVSLWCPKAAAHARLIARGSTDVADRIRAWDETDDPPCVDLAIDTGTTSPTDAAKQIRRLTPQPI
jgi:guanylate kinase